MVSRASSAASLATQLVAACVQELSRLVGTHEGLFVISDHPGRACILSNGKAHDWIRFYTDNIDHAHAEAGAEAPPRQSTDEGVWHTWRMQLNNNTTPAEQSGALSVRRLEDGDGGGGEVQRVFKYALVGSPRFWRLASSAETLLRRLRVRVETRLFDTPDDLVPCAVSGPATLPQALPALRRDGANGEPQTRLVSSVEEWLMGSKDSLRDEMLATNAGALVVF